MVKGITEDYEMDGVGRVGVPFVLSSQFSLGRDVWSIANSRLFSCFCTRQSTSLCL